MDIRRKLLECYPVVLEMLSERGFDASMYAPMTVQMVKICEEQLFVEPIVVKKTLDAVGREGSVPWPFSANSRELRILKSINGGDVDEAAKAIAVLQSRYPRLGNFLGANYKNKDLCQKLLKVYTQCALPIAEVHFCCFDSSKLAAQFDRIFKAVVDSMEKTLEADVMSSHVGTFKELDELDEQACMEIEKEVLDLYMHARTVILIADNPKKLPLDTPTMIHVQVFCIHHLMFNVRKHKFVPRHDILDVWQHDKEIAALKSHYHITRLHRELPIIYTSDPVAKFIGLRKDNICRITDTNSTSGTYIKYRYCRSG